MHLCILIPTWPRVSNEHSTPLSSISFWGPWGLAPPQPLLCLSWEHRNVQLFWYIPFLPWYVIQQFLLYCVPSCWAQGTLRSYGLWRFNTRSWVFKGSWGFSLLIFIPWAWPEMGWARAGDGALCGTTMTNLLLLLVSLFFQPMGFYLGSVGLTQLQRILPNVLVRANFMLWFLHLCHK